MRVVNKKVLSVFLQRNSLGVCMFSFDTMLVQCSSIRNVCVLAYPLIRQKIIECDTLLCNNLNHEIFQVLDMQRIKVVSINEKMFDQQLIEHNLSKLASHVNNMTNPQAYFKQFSRRKYKFEALGIMLNYLLNESGLILKEKLYIQDIEFFVDTLFQFVQIGKEALQFLQITKEDLHPSLIKGKGASKEGYSVISAYQAFLSSTGSKRVLRYIFMNPTFNTQVLEQRFEVIGWMKNTLKQSNRYHKYFRNIHVLQTIIKKFGRIEGEGEEQWKKLLKTLEAMIQLRKLFDMDNLPSLIYDYVNDQNWTQIISIFNILKSAIQFNPFGIKGGIDETLDELKKTYDNMPHILTLVAKQQQWDIEFRIVFMTQVGYLIKISNDIILPSSFNEQDWVLQFSNDSGRYYSNSLTQSLDQDYGDIFGQIQDIQKKIIFDMQAMLVQRQSILLNLYWKLCEIECYWGISQLSKSMSRPKLSSEGLIVSNGWHVLLSGDVIHNNSFSFCQSQAPSNFVYNSEANLVNTNYSNRCMLITGPNASGKTVYIKQLSIIIYLAHLGCFVPASFAEIPLVDSIVFVGKTDSIYNDQKCGFQAELKSLSSIVQPNIISNKSLILIDQLGSQIDYENSLKLMYATIEYLTSKSTKFLKNRLLTKRNDQFSTPIVVIVTHLSEILRGNIIEQNYLIRFLTMQVEEEGLRLFKIKPGLVNKGYGIKTASKILPKSVIVSSQRFMRLIGQL